ncbi:membrane protein insertion efficiency factor YidD [Photobacterium galatheae]|uniref:Membrane protein insertion efficiency factor YidD n=1 Tax=Photobacterium galatheae TaxID=1654360 RepID=A0A066RUQ8_9GAMM|nr:membrane protein insertion efficiency factor YidD [Photobacterium galatheae]KDM92841.1 hypothetical protein EA58_03530 [Photobacterium galatheae]MCM0148194.1 membrane protein insertion efficiency factor YidD [Photobacterium galatheae]
MKVIAIRSIRWYQKYVSPYKGYRCAHAAFHGGQSCSQATIEILQTATLTECPAAVLERFSACWAASIQLNQSKRKSKRRRRQEDDDAACCSLLFLPFDLLN